MAIFGDWSKGDFFADNGPMGGVRDNRRSSTYSGVRWKGQDGNMWYKDQTGTHTRGPQRWTNYKEIADPGRHQNHTPGTAGPGPSNYPNLNLNAYNGGGGGGGNRASAAQLAEYQQGIDQAQHNLGRVDTQLGVRHANINDEWRKKTDALDSSIARARNQYDTQVTQNKQQRRNEVNLINDKASGDLRGLLSVLGARGANGSDVDKVARAVQDKATRERSGSSTQYAKQAQELDINWNNFQQDADKERRDINDWKVNEERGAHRDAETQRQSLHTLLAQLRSQQAEARGANGANAGRADLNRARELSGSIDNLARLQTTHTGKDVVYKPATLDSYKVDTNTEVKVGNTDGTAGDQAATIYDGKEDKDRKKQNWY